MVPVAFPEANMVLSRPPTMTDQECEPLHVTSTTDANGHSVIVSCWKLTLEEVKALTEGKRLWLIVYGGVMPPIALSGVHPFVEDEPPALCDEEQAQDPPNFDTGE